LYKDEPPKPKLSDSLTQRETLAKDKNEEYVSATASTIEGAQRLIEAGFDYVTELDRVKVFRKRK
jgi:hypothetical protein